MAITDRSLTPGTRLSARYKKAVHTCTVEANADGSLAFVLADGQRFKSPSAAGTAVMNGSACNGWRFWSLAEGEAPQAAAAPQKQAKNGKAKAHTLIKRVAVQDDAPAGQVRYFCSACMDTFFAPAGEDPTTCPQGHGEPPAA